MIYDFRFMICDFVGAADEDGVGVGFEAVVEEDAGIGRLGAANEEDDVVGAGEVLQLGYAVSDVSTDRVVVFE